MGNGKGTSPLTCLSHPTPNPVSVVNKLDFSPNLHMLISQGNSGEVGSQGPGPPRYQGRRGLGPGFLSLKEKGVWNVFGEEGLTLKIVVSREERGKRGQDRSQQAAVTFQPWSGQ